MTPTLYLLFGPQGSGKTTQAERLAKTLDLPFFDTGSQLRKLAGEGSPLGQQIAETMQSGQLISNDILDRMVENYITHHQLKTGMVMDGFPRNLDQCQVLAGLVSRYHWRVVGICIEISDQTAKDRLAQRFEIVDGQRTTRPDDQPEIVEKRLATYKAQTLPVLDWLKTNYQLLIIDGEPAVDEVTQEINDALATT